MPSLPFPPHVAIWRSFACMARPRRSAPLHPRPAVDGYRGASSHPASRRSGEHRLDNGLLLSADAHILFDRGYLGIDAKDRLRVSPRLREEFAHGDGFYARAGQAITLPIQRNDRPAREFTEWHMDTKFKAS